MNTNILARLFRAGDGPFSRPRSRPNDILDPFARPDEGEPFATRTDDLACWFAMMDRADALDLPGEEGDRAAEPGR